ncbi:transferase [Mycobacterium kiyosense]|uniref:Transferase n=1 Tax=Mycobacterium kiyosense TaxID=2871094 RepID=A0A9P3UYH8_9MYCO|nr:transferase [Mycobacterium kiyosense]BDE16217.1 transferase [Mycobacterium sp. 20KCMC460]GLB82112.1 transferase [Mycobacterium kiyosense]GLB90597.1 transferase [Mycobacterium kiyosense]GLB95254.1 transferase [Mycobacterium kiyosense]
MPAADHFPPADQPVDPQETAHALAMDLCGRCGLAQLADDDTVTEEPRGVEPQALRDQAADAVQRVADRGWLRGRTVREFGSPHGGTWLSLLAERGLAEAEVADLVLDSFGVMHEADQRAGFELRAKVTAPDGVLLVQFPSLMAMIEQGQWNSLRHGHFGYYSLTAIGNLLRAAGMSIATAWEFDLYGGTFLVAAVHGHLEPDRHVEDILAREREFGVTRPEVLRRMQQAVDAHAVQLREWLVAQADQGHRVYGYAAGSRVPALFSIAKVDRRLVQGVADGSPAKQGRRLPGTDIAIISPEQLIAADPDRVLLTLPDLYGELQRQYPQFAGRWWVDNGPLQSPTSS